MAFYLAQASGLLNGSFPWSVNSVLTSNNTEAAVATAFDSAMRGWFTNATLAPFIPPGVTMTETSVSTASAAFKQTTKTVTTGSDAGASTSAALPFHTCEIVTFRTPFATKWGRGRWYLPPLATNALAANGFEILAAAQAAMQTAFNAYFATVGASYQHVILHRHATASGGRGALTTDTVSAVDIPNTFAVQKRRADKLVPSRLSVVI